MTDGEDEELEYIKRKMMRELLGRANMNRQSRNATSRPIIATDHNFNELINRYPLVFVDFWADWCLPCRVIAPVIEELAEEFAGKIVFLKVNVDENPITASRYGITSIPTLMIFKNGRPADVIVGAYPKKVIEERIKKNLMDI
ncbi:MAG: thioredoxin [Nitrososphaerota archaeon]